MKKTFVLLLLASFCACPAFPEASVTIYNDDRALVKEIRDVKLKKGVQTIEFDDVAAKIDASSVLPKFFNNAGKIKILEQNFDYDLLSPEKLLAKYIGKEVEIERTGNDLRRGKIKGGLLSVNGGLAVRTDKKIILNPPGEISMETLPDGLRLKPTLTWLVDSSFEGADKMEVSYQTSGINWHADYVMVTDEKDEFADITGWVTVNNNSGSDFKDAKIKLVAGDVNTADDRDEYLYEAGEDINSAETRALPSFKEKPFFEYHIYELSRKSSLKNNEMKQIEFIRAENIAVEKILVYNGAHNGSAVAVNLEFKNSRENKLGIPLPKGRIRVSKYDGDCMEFVGGDDIGHTAKDAKISLYTGNAFGVTGERTRTNYKTLSKSAEESYKITVKNSKKSSVDVKIVEPMRGWDEWKITESSAKFSKKDSHTAECLVNVAAGSEKTVTYTVKYIW